MFDVVGTVAWDTLALVDRLPAAEVTAGVRELARDVPGGAAGNVAMAMARLGATPRVVATVGDDFDDAAMRAGGVDASGLHRVTGATSRAYIFYAKSGEQATFFAAGAGHDLDPSTTVTGRAHFAAGPINDYPRLMRMAEQVSFDAGQEAHHRAFDEIARCLEYVDILFVNQHEREVFEQHGWTLAEALGGRTRLVIETRGAEGTLVHTREGRYHAPAVPTDMLEPTGAGDAHRAGTLVALARGAAPDVAARVGNVVSSFVITRVGPQTGLPTWGQVASRYHDAYGELSLSS